MSPAESARGEYKKESPDGLSETMPKVAAMHGATNVVIVNESNALVTIFRPVRGVTDKFDDPIRRTDRVQV